MNHLPIGNVFSDMSHESQQCGLIPRILETLDPATLVDFVHYNVWSTFWTLDDSINVLVFFATGYCVFQRVLNCQ